MIRSKKRIEQHSEREFDTVKEGLSQSQVAAFITDLVNQNRELSEKVTLLTLLHHSFLSHLENLIAETRSSEKEMEQTRVRAEEGEPEILASSVPISQVSNNVEKESHKLEAALDSKSATILTSNSQTAEEATADESATPSPPSDDSLLFEGEAEIAMVPPADMAQLIRLRRNLRDIPHLKILRTYGRRNGGAAITILIDKPLPLIRILTEMPEVEKVEPWADGATTDNDSPWGLAPEVGLVSWQRKKILVTLNFSEVT